MIMLGLADFDAILLPLEILYDQFSRAVLSDIARRLVKTGRITATAAWQAQRLVESGKVFEDVIKRISELTSLSEEELAKAFKEAGVRSLTFDNRILKRAGITGVNLNLSPAMQQVLLEGLKKTESLLKNLTLTTANTAQTAFFEAMDLAYMEVAHGTMSYSQAIRQAIKSVASKGLEVINYPSGRKDQIDVAIRRALLTGVSQTAAGITWKNIEDNNIDLIEVSAHIGARNKGTGPENHEQWQGKVYSRTGNPKYPDFITSTGFGTVTGLSGINCRHSFYPYFEGTPRNYSEQTLEEYGGKTVTYRGEEIDFYKATQIQRKIERDIRAKKREAAVLGSVGKDNTKEIQEIRSLQARMRNFIKQTGLHRQPDREGGRVVLVRGPE